MGLHIKINGDFRPAQRLNQADVGLPARLGQDRIGHTHPVGHILLKAAQYAATVAEDIGTHLSPAPGRQMLALAADDPGIATQRQIIVGGEVDTAGTGTAAL